MKAVMGKDSFLFNTHREFLEKLYDEFIPNNPTGGKLMLIADSGEKGTFIVGVEGEGFKARAFVDRFLGKRFN